MNTIDNVIADVVTQMESRVETYKTQAQAFADRAMNGNFPSSFASAALVESQARAEGAYKVLLVVSAYDNNVDVMVSLLRNRLEDAIFSNVILTNQEIFPIYESLKAIEAACARHATESSENVCGDFPAPCNCDDSRTHNGH